MFRLDDFIQLHLKLYNKNSVNIVRRDFGKLLRGNLGMINLRLVIPVTIVTLNNLPALFVRAFGLGMTSCYIINKWRRGLVFPYM